MTRRACRASSVKTNPFPPLKFPAAKCNQNNSSLAPFTFAQARLRAPRPRRTNTVFFLSAVPVIYRYSQSTITAHPTIRNAIYGTMNNKMLPTL